MSYLLYQLRFNTAVHFGGSDSALSLYHSEDRFRADTLFSALCHTALQMEGETGLNRLLTMGQCGKLLLSDAMPWAGDTYYLPKPCFQAQTNRELPAEHRKTLKKLAWIPVERFEEYCTAMQTGELYLGSEEPVGVNIELTKARMDLEKDALPYPVGLYQFKDNCGLYVLVHLADDSDRLWMRELMTVLGISGIGGKVTAGYGKFTVANEISLSESDDAQACWLFAALTATQGKQMLLTTALPQEEELEAALQGASYQLVRRAGFVASNSYADTAYKKQTQYYLGSGAVLNCRFNGDIYAVGNRGAHPVYRYGKPMFLGVNL